MNNTVLNKLTPIALAITVMTVSTPSRAELAERTGFSGAITVHAGYGSSDSQMNPTDDNQVTNSLDGKGKKESGAVFFPIFRFNYTLASNQTQFYIGASENKVVEGDFKTEFGVVQDFGSFGIVTVGYAPFTPFAKDETWSDPFVTDAKRQKTDQDTQAFRLRVDELAGLPFSVEYGYGQREVDKERSGQALGLTAAERARLNRDGDFHGLTLESVLPVGPDVVFLPSFQYIRGDMEGEAYSFDSYEFGGTVMGSFLDVHSVSATVSAGSRDYDASHPVFGKKREDKMYGIFATYSYDRPFGWSDTAFISTAGYSSTTSNIKFYESQEYMVSVGMAYTF
ncbi:DUF2860 family protein [Thaumasiovibrio subtropicus]|uniref:DUF2860 family protein n=1 Tax=Thaumasiovibrio subtropicus TaxID=1891207 RepID=UPI00131DF5AF|nr:DUF2860 family protein [Thaumasiovibrio subtropicus]